MTPRKFKHQFYYFKFIIKHNICHSTFIRNIYTDNGRRNFDYYGYAVKLLIYNYFSVLSKSVFLKAIFTSPNLLLGPILNQTVVDTILYLYSASHIFSTCLFLDPIDLEIVQEN